MSREAIEQDSPRVDTLPFESQHQYMATLHDARAQSESVIYLKGSVESVLSRCGDACGAGLEVEPIDKERIQRQVEEMAASGLRVLALARKMVPVGCSVSHAF